MVVILILAIHAFMNYGCKGDFQIPVKNQTDQNPSTMNFKDTTSIEGKITEVMESWPLQLIVRTENGDYNVGLLSETVITRSGETVSPGSLSPMLEVRIAGTIKGDRSMIARSIEVMN